MHAEAPSILNEGAKTSNEATPSPPLISPDQLKPNNLGSSGSPFESKTHESQASATEPTAIEIEQQTK